MRRWFGILALVLAATGARAQPAPQLTIEMPEGEVIVGQPVTLRLKLLVPTWMPKPPVWPNFEVPSLLVRLPERATTAISESIEGETWSGVSRTYRLYPLEVGGYEIPAQKMRISYADPGKPDPISAELTIDAIRFDAVLPAGAKGLNPPVVAEGLSLEQSIEGGVQMMTGDAVTRIVTASIQGTTPILLPGLMPDLMQNPGSDPSSDPAPLRAYPKEPVLSETEENGVLSGSLTQSTTYVAQAGGNVELAPITLNWFNLQSGTVETAELGGLSLVITAPPPPPPGPADYARWGGLGLGMLALIWGFARAVWPRLRRLHGRMTARWRGSETYAHTRVLRAIRARDLTQTLRALDIWAGFHPALTRAESDPLAQVLAGIGAARFGRAGQSGEVSIWKGVAHAYRHLRRSLHSARRKQQGGEALPGLNPFRGEKGLFRPVWQRLC